LFTGYLDIAVIEEAIQKAQVYRFISKPWNVYDLKMTVRQGLRLFDLEAENRKLRDKKKFEERPQEFYDQQIAAGGILEDIQEEKKKTEIKDRQISSLAQFVDESPQPILRIGDGFKIVYGNRASEQFLGMIGTKIGGFFSDDWNVFLKKVIEQKIMEKREIEIQDKVYSCYLVPGKDEFVYFYAEDITGLYSINKKLQSNEHRLRSMFDALQKAHNEIREIHEQLLQSEKMASIGHLAAGVAHEINNPVGFISSNL
jgi:hypothetical protein